MFQTKPKGGKHLKPKEKGGSLSKLTRSQKRQIDQTITAAKGNPDKPQSVQASIPYLAMYPDGVCRVTDKLYSKTLEFSDVNYMLASKDEQTAIFENLCDFYNYFDPSISVQETFISRRAANSAIQGGAKHCFKQNQKAVNI